MHRYFRAYGFSLIIIVCFFIVAFSGVGFAQSPPTDPEPTAQSSPTPQASPSPSLERQFFKNVLRDQRAIWTAPFSLQRSDAKWIVPLAASSAVLFATDRHSAGEMIEPGDHHTRLNISADISRAGTFYATGAVAGVFYLVGRVKKDQRARETGLLSAEALIHSGIVVTVLKTASQRPRPPTDDASGEFYDKGSSFPSGHAANAWSVATVIAYEYGKHRPLVSVAAYGLAAAVSMSRYTGANHFLSDVLIGSAVGYGIGRYVYRTHHDPSLDEGSDPTKNTRPRSKLIPSAYPIYARGSHVYGLSCSWSF